MAKLTLADILSGFVSNVVLNDNNTRIEAAIENTLSRDGTGPNFMESTLDMNGNLIINQANPISVEGFNWEGPWQTGILYKVGDVIERNSSSYICIVEHIAGDFPTDLSDGKWQLVASSADLPAQSGNQGKYLTTDGATASWGSVITPFAQTLLDDTNATDARITLGVPSLSSPIFTGTPAAPTPPRFDNSLRLATTEFVQKEGLHYKLGTFGIQITTNTLLTVESSGHWFDVDNPGLTVVLPDVSTSPIGSTYTLRANYDYILQGSGSDVIRRVPFVSNMYQVLAGQTTTVVSNGVGFGWYVVSAGFGSETFRATKSSVGHLELPNGFILNWGIFSAGDDSYTPVIFDKTFTSAVLCASATAIRNAVASGPSATAAHVGNVQLSGMYVGLSNVESTDPSGAYWFALGI